jgi:tetratricopeptide (TPR) repeat protein
MPGIHYALAKAYRADHQTIKALDAARRCVELAPQFADGHYLLGQLYRDSGKPKQARQHFEQFRLLKNSAGPVADPAR